MSAAARAACAQHTACIMRHSMSGLCSTGLAPGGGSPAHGSAAEAAPLAGAQAAAGTVLVHPSMLLLLMLLSSPSLAAARRGGEQGRLVSCAVHVCARVRAFPCVRFLHRHVSRHASMHRAKSLAAQRAIVKVQPSMHAWHAPVPHPLSSTPCAALHAQFLSNGLPNPYRNQFFKQYMRYGCGP